MDFQVFTLPIHIHDHFLLPGLLCARTHYPRYIAHTQPLARGEVLIFLGTVGQAGASSRITSLGLRESQLIRCTSVAVSQSLLLSPIISSFAPTHTRYIAHTQPRPRGGVSSQFREQGQVTRELANDLIGAQKAQLIGCTSITIPCAHEPTRHPQ